MPERELQFLELAGLLHDIGKIGIPEHILNKKGALSDAEYAIVKQHPVSGSRILRDISEMSDIALYVRHHHERFDGKGYPDGLTGERIPLPARILAIADAYDAITSTRPYRGASSRTAALAELKRAAGAQFDPKLVEVFVRLNHGARRARGRAALMAKYPGLSAAARSGAG
jgi:HD-GYP domain-containing protein (c-di-GMP phosphodiesterase class II)